MSDPVVVLMIVFAGLVLLGQDLFSPLVSFVRGDGLTRQQRFWGRVGFSLIGIALAAYVIATPGHSVAEISAAWGAVTAIIGFWFGFRARGNKDENR